MIYNNPNCGKCGMLNRAGYCQLTACLYPYPIKIQKSIKKTKTKGDCIRSMTDEELADLLYATMRGDNICDPYSEKDDWLEWLKQEVE